MAFEQGYAEHIFQRTSAPADRGLPNTQHLRRPTEAQMLSDRERMGGGNKIDHTFGLHSQSQALA